MNGRNICQTCNRELCVCISADAQSAIRKAVAEQELESENERQRQEQEYRRSIEARGACALTAYEIGMLRRVIERETVLANRERLAEWARREQLQQAFRR